MAKRSRCKPVDLLGEVKFAVKMHDLKRALEIRNGLPFMLKEGADRLIAPLLVAPPVLEAAPVATAYAPPTLEDLESRYDGPIPKAELQAWRQQQAACN